MLERQSFWGRVLICFVVVGSLVTLAGCKKQAVPPQELAAVVAFAGNDVNPDGTLSEKTLAAIASKSKEKTLGVKFIRTSLSDAGLAQLAPFMNIRHVEAASSRITKNGIAKLKEAIPEVTVVK